MQVAERWIGYGTMIACTVALGSPALRSTTTTAKRTEHVDLAPHRCSEGRVLVPTPPEPPQVAPRDPPVPPAAVDLYEAVFLRARPQLVECFHDGETRVELLITIAPDGHVERVSHRPNPSTPATRCATVIVEKLRFPHSPSTLAIRVPLTSE